MRHTRTAVVLAVLSGSLLLALAQPEEHAQANHGLHAAALGAWAQASQPSGWRTGWVDAVQAAERPASQRTPLLTSARH